MMSDRFKEALGELNGMFHYEAPAWVSNFKEPKLSDKSMYAIKEALTLATESEQLRKERDELAAYIRKNHDVLDVPTEIFNLCIQNR